MAKQVIVLTDTFGEGWTKQNENNTELYATKDELDAITDTRIPFKSGAALADSALYETLTELISDKKFTVPGGTLGVSEAKDISAGSESLIITDNIAETNSYLVDSKFDSTGSAIPTYLNLGSEGTLNIQTDFSQTLTDNPLTYSLTGTVTPPDVRQLNSMLIKTGGVMTNATARFIDNVTGIPIRYIPSRAAWNGTAAGLTLVDGDNLFDFISTEDSTPGVFNLGVNPFKIENGQQIDIEFKADSVNILGEIGGIPYQIATTQDGPVTYIITGDIGLDKEVLFNDAGEAGTDPGFEYDKSTGTLSSTIVKTNRVSGENDPAENYLDLSSSSSLWSQLATNLQTSNPSGIIKLIINNESMLYAYKENVRMPFPVIIGGTNVPSSTLMVRDNVALTDDTMGLTVHMNQAAGDTVIRYTHKTASTISTGIDGSDGLYKFSVGVGLGISPVWTVGTDGIFNIIKAINFNPISAPTHVEGHVYYDSVDKSLSYQTSSDGVTNNIGKEIFVPPRVLNDQGVAITNGQAVYISDTDGTFPKVKLAQADSSITSASVGLITETSIANGSQGYCTTYGLVRDFNTASWANGDVLYLSPTVAGGLQNTKPVFPNFAIRMGIVINSDVSGTIFVTYPNAEQTTGSTPVVKSYSIADPGGDDVSYLAGFYDAPTTNTTLSLGGTTTQTYGTALGAKAAHAFCVAFGAGGTDNVLTVSGISITDGGVRNDSDSEILIADTDQASTNQYFETTKKWLGQVTYTLTGAVGFFSFNYGFAKYEDFNNNLFTLISFDILFQSNVNATNQGIEVMHHQPINWTYAITGFVPGSDSLISMADDYGVNTSIFSGEQFPYKRTGLSFPVNGSSDEGVIVRLTQTTNNPYSFGTAHIGVLI
jgi:hypothetical protein